MTKLRSIAAAAVLSMLAVVAPAYASEAGAASGRTVDVIVVLDEAHAPGGHAANQRRAAEVARSHGLQPSHTYGTAIFGFAAAVPEGRISGLERDPRVTSVQEDGVMHAVGDPTGVRRIDADDVRGSTVGASGAGISVAILDTGIAKHGDLPNIGVGTSCIAGTTTDDDHGHGTHVAGTVGASLNSSVTGVAPDVTLLPVKVLDAGGSGEWSEIICGVDWVAAQNIESVKVHVANLSLGGSGSYSGETCGEGGDPLFDSLCKAIASGTTFTVAAGNDSKDASGFVPAAHPQVVTVSAYSDTDGVASTSTSCSGRGLWKTCDESFASFSNFGDIVDVMAPGVNIESTTNTGGTGTKSGTSMAAPHVAGVVALLLEKNPGMKPAAVEAHLKATGQCPDTKQVPAAGACAGVWHNDPDGTTEPMVNALFAVQALGGGDGGGEPATPPTASFTASCSGLTCSFDASGSTAGVSYSWAFGDGTAADVVAPSKTYGGAGTYSVTLTVTDAGGQDTEVKQITVTAPAGITLSAAPYKVKGSQTVDLTWSGAGSTSVDVRRNGATVATTANDGAYTDSIGKGGGTYTYKVCEAGSTTICSSEVTVTF